MSGLNRRGPSGEGPMTGRRMGRCNPDNKRKKGDETLQNQDSELQGNSTIGCGKGRGQGFRNGFGRFLKLHHKGRNE